MSEKKASSDSHNPYPTYSDPENSPNSQCKLPNAEFLRFETRKIARIVAFDRPAALHALSYSMINDLTAALKLWDSSPLAKVVVFQGGPLPNGKKSFCAGGDVVALCKSRGRTRDQCEFFRREYALNHYISTLSKPIVSIIDGIVMGGGAGLSIHGQFRVATENTVFAMPETAIGFWPDVGASFFLPRLEGGLGYYLGLSGARLKGQDVYHAGLATHFIPSHRLDDVLETLSCSGSTPTIINSLLNQFSGDLLPFSLKLLQEAIDTAFLAPNLNTVVTRLREFASNDKNEPVSQWAQQTLSQLSQHSPTALQTTFALLQRGSKLSLKGALRCELALAQNYVEKVEDLYTGIEAKLIHKHGQPKWTPESLAEIDSIFIKSLFSKPSDPIILNFYNEDDFENYPHANFALPTSAQVKSLLPKYRNVSDRSSFVGELIKNHFGAGKLGVQQHLESIVNKHIAYRSELSKGGSATTSNLNWI